MVRSRPCRTRENMSLTRLLGLIFALVLIFDKGRTESAILDNGQDQDPTASQNSFSVQIPLGSGNVIQTDNQVAPQRRLSLEDFFLNRNNEQEQQQAANKQEEPLVNFNVQQPDPNSVLLVRDTQFPSPTGGLISRLILARRMLRLRRIARRLSFLPRMLRLGLGVLQRPRIANASPLALFSNRIGEAYDPREYVFGNKGYTYQNNATETTQQIDANNQDQAVQQTRGYTLETDPYYGRVADSNYDDSLDDSRNYNSEDLNELKKQQEILNSLSDEQQILLLQQLQNYQQQLNQLEEQLNQQQQLQLQEQSNNQNRNNINLQNYQNQGQAIDFNPIQHQQPQQIPQQQPDQFQQPLQHVPAVQNEIHQPQTLNNNHLEELRELQLQLAQEQQLQQQLQQQLRQLQLTQQAQNLKHQQNLAALEKQNNNHQQPIQTIQQVTSNSAGDRTEGGQYSSPIGIGGSAGIGVLPGNTIGAGINVAIKPPSVDVQVTKPGSSQIKPLPPLVNPIAPKPVPVAPAVEPLVPIGILPKPILNLKGRMFLGAELGNGVGVQVGR